MRSAAFVVAVSFARNWSETGGSILAPGNRVRISLQSCWLNSRYPHASSARGNWRPLSCLPDGWQMDLPELSSWFAKEDVAPAD
jgi:hypothetical protein